MTSTHPTVLLVHGAFADGSSWREVIAELQTDGIPVRALAQPLRGLYTDAAADRAGATTTSVEASHAVAVSQPRAVTDAIPGEGATCPL